MRKIAAEQLDALTATLAGRAGEYDSAGTWPAKSVAALAAAGGWTWVVPAEYGGDPVSQVDLLRIYDALAAGCLSTALIATQRDGAVELIATSPNEPLKQRLLPRLARGELFTTVGISQLTTSRRRGGHLLRAARDGDGYRLDGVMPWVTGAEQADCIVTGGVLADGEQMLACVPVERAGLSIGPAEHLLALTASRTSRVTCTDCRIEPEEVVRGPGPEPLSMRTPVKPLVTTTCGLGLARALLATISGQPAGTRTQFVEALQPLERRFQEAEAALYRAAEQAETGQYEMSASDLSADLSAADLRVMVNDLVIRAAVTALTLAKGTGFIKGDPVERLTREALFFLVWSATSGVRLETLISLMGPLGGAARH